MFKRIGLIMLCLCLALAVGCKKNNLDVEKVDSEPVVSEVPVPENTNVNPLTGLSGLDKEAINNRPVAITINNIKIAQPVQTGLNQADIIYETEVEGGITRLLAVFQDVSKVKKIGTVRSARYVFVDLAMGHNAIYIHHGRDYFHIWYHINDVDRMELSTSNGGVRVSNGLATEHTLYAYGDKLAQNIAKKNFKIKNDKVTKWQNFASESETIKHDKTANSVTVPFTSNVKSTFTYDAETGRYTRSFNDTVRKDYSTGESVTVKNVFVLNTTIRNYHCTGDDVYQHREVLLQSGNGYYFVNGTYTPIKWSKGADKDSLKLTNTDGTPLEVNAGNSWVCFADKTKSQPVIK